MRKGDQQADSRKRVPLFIKMTPVLDKKSSKQTTTGPAFVPRYFIVQNKYHTGGEEDEVFM